VFGNKEVSYIGFTLTPEGIKPGKNKLKAFREAKLYRRVSFFKICPSLSLEVSSKIIVNI
jgi:hypothetical protein